MAPKDLNIVEAARDNEDGMLDLSQKEHRFHGNDDRFRTHVGKRTAQEMVSTGQAGYLLFGPYIPLAGGDYRVVLHGALGEYHTASAHVDVVIEEGNRLIAQSIIDKPENGCLLSLPISLPPCDDFQVRVWVQDHSQVAISLVEIQTCKPSELENAEPQPTECEAVQPPAGPPPPGALPVEAVEQILTVTPSSVQLADIAAEDGVGNKGLITVRNLTKIYYTRRGPITVLDDINLQIVKGEKVGIVGRNGSGKSTLIRLISGAEPPTHGHIERGMSVSWPLAFGGGFQGTLTGLDNLRFICRLYNKDYETALPFVEDFSELGHFLSEPVKKYSSGMRARLAFALSMAVEFDCFLIDEIIAVGDARFHGKCNMELFEKRKDRAMIIVSHMPDFIRCYCDRAAVLIAGKLHMFDEVDEAYAFYQDHMAWR